ncbi:MAG: hypothetical protein EB059_03610, partial [Alphaproteobacteria bacterium]|nr:hypothetical protein [Alphaproteobacteria bacterium]
MTTALEALDFSDLYLRLDGDAPALFRPRKIGQFGRDSHFVPDDCKQDITNLISYINQHFQKDNGSFAYLGMRLRAAAQTVNN